MCYGLCSYEDRYGEPRPGCKANRDSYCNMMNAANALYKELGREPTEEELKAYLDEVYDYGE